MSILGVQADVDMFMAKMGQALPARPMTPDQDVLKLRIDLITEEFDETISALLELAADGETETQEIAHLAEVADGICDLVYVAVGTASALGIDLEPIWEEVQRSNMQKLTGPVRADGKRLKPPDWKPPMVARAIANQIAAAS